MCFKKPSAVSCAFISFAIVITASGCGKNNNTSVSTAGTSSSSSGNQSSGTTLSFTPQEFAATLAANTTPAAYGANGTIYTYAGSEVVKSPDLQGPNNVVISSPSIGTFAINLNVFDGMTVQQAVSAYVKLQQSGGETIVLPNGQTLTEGSGGYTYYPDPQPTTASSAGNSNSGSTGFVNNGSNSFSTGSNGSSGGTFVPYVAGVINVVSVEGMNSAGNILYQDLGGNLYQDQTGTKDVDLQRADLQDQKLDSEAQALQDKFEMSAESAHQLAVLADKVQETSASGTITDEARDEIARAALHVAGLTTDDVNDALAKMVQDGDQQAIDDLMDKAASNLGMPSSAGLRDQLLPALGIQFQ